VCVCQRGELQNAAVSSASHINQNQCVGAVRQYVNGLAELKVGGEQDRTSGGPQVIWAGTAPAQVRGSGVETRTASRIVVRHNGTTEQPVEGRTVCRQAGRREPGSVRVVCV